MKIVYAVADSGCAYWRAKQPCKMIKKKGLAETQIFQPLMIESEMQNMLAWGDVVFLQSPMGVDMVATVARLKKDGKAVIADYDDLSFSLSPFNPAYKTLGQQEVIIEHEGKKDYVWKDGRDVFSIKANYLRYRSLQDLLGMFSLVTTTGKFIKDKYSEFAREISIVPNSIDFDLFKPFPKEETGQIRIGWTPSDSHYVEIWMIKRIMRKIFKKYGNKVKFVVLGNLIELGMEFNKEEMERYDFIGLDTYPLKLASLNLDIGLCPLDKTDFNRAKSPLKWSEYSAMKVPSIVSKLEPYNCVVDYETGLIADDEEEFYNKLCELIDNAELRNKITANAFDKNYEDYNLDKNILLWMDAYERAYDYKDELPILKEGDLVKEASHAT